MAVSPLVVTRWGYRLAAPFAVPGGVGLISTSGGEGTELHTRMQLARLDTATAITET